MIRLDRRSDGTREAVAEVVVGVETRQVRVPLGSFAADVDPGGLRNAPVVVVTADVMEPVVRAGAERAGRASVSRLGRDPGTTIGAALLLGSAVAEVLVVVGNGSAAARTLVTARALGGRPLPVVPLDDLEAAEALLSECWVDLDVALPSADFEDRIAIRRAADTIGLFGRHHVVDVDPRPALGGSRPPAPSGSRLHVLTAAATGVLAGRVAAGNRRWR